MTSHQMTISICSVTMAARLSTLSCQTCLQVMRALMASSQTMTRLLTLHALSNRIPAAVTLHVLAVGQSTMTMARRFLM